MVKTRVAKERLNDECVRANYKESIGRAWNGVMGGMNVDENVDNLFERMAVEVNSVVEEVCGIKKIIGNRNRGDAWWTNEVKEAVEKKEKGFHKME